MSDKRLGWLQFACVMGFIVVSLVISRLLDSGGGVNRASGGGDRALFVETVAVKPGPYRIQFSTTGLLETRADIAIVPQVSGRVIDVNENFFDGGVFDAREQLFTIDPDDYRLQVQRLASELARAQTTLEVEQAQADIGINDWRQVHGDKPVPDLVARRPQVAEAQAGMRSAQASLDEAELALRRTRFNLPFNGRVLESSIAQGQYVVAGQSYGRVFDMRSLEITASLEDKQLSWLLGAKNAEIVVSTTFMGEKRSYPAKLKRGAGFLDAGTRFASVTFGFESEVRELLPGLFMELTIRGEELDDIAEIPIAALQEQGRLWQVNDDQRLAPLSVETVHVGDGHVAVRGLTGSEKIVVSRITGAATGMRVIAESTVVEESGAGNGVRVSTRQ